DARAYKMSKSRGNVINPDDIVRQYGADTLRLYEMFMGPLEQMKPWSMKGVEGVFRFLNRVWRMLVDEETGALLPCVTDADPTPEQLRLLHGTIKKVTEDIENMRFNTAISAMMVFVNEALKWEIRPRSVMETFVLLLSPFAPHIAEELWEKLGHEQTLAYEPWPEYDEALIQEDTVEVVVQVNGKLRYKLQVPRDLPREVLEKQALENERISTLIDGKQVVKVIVVPNKLVNIVVR
ncbi:MAG: leucine--tRNA ligase, partial [Calditrichaeota bacterium]